MTTQMISMQDYEGFGGFTSFAELANTRSDELRKALAAGYQSPRTDGGGALRVESLEQTLRIVTFRGEHIELWKDIPKMPAISTVHEWNRQTSYGVDGMGGFTGEGEAGQVVDSAYERAAAFLKFMSVQGEITHPMLLVKHAHGDIVAQQTRDKALFLLQLVERALFFGKSASVPKSFDGLDQQLRTSPYASSNIFDLRGGVLTDDRIEDGVNAIIHLYGRGTDLYSAPQAMSDLSKEYYAKQRTMLPAPSDGVAGGSFSAFQSANGGRINLKRDIFLRSGLRNNGVKTAPSSPTSSKVPNPVTSAAASNGAQTGTLFGTADLGAYRYKVTAINEYGESAAVQDSGAVTVTAGDGVSLLITDGGGSFPATGYRVYRSLVGGAAGTEQFIYEVPRGAGAAATTTWIDLNRFLPGCSKAYLFQVNQTSMAVAQLAPMMKLPLATIGPSLRWLHLLYLTAILYTGQWSVIFDNVKDA